MAYDLNTTSFVAMIILLLIASHTYIHKTSAAGECGKMPISAAVAKISPCVGVAESANSKVPPACCTRVASLLKTSPSCFCAVFLSPLVKHSGINLAIAISIPKRCSIKNRPVGKKCGNVNRRGWWDYDIEGFDIEEVGCNEVWEGMESITFGVLEWH